MSTQKIVLESVKQRLDKTDFVCPGDDEPVYEFENASYDVDFYPDNSYEYIDTQEVKNK